MTFLSFYLDCVSKRVFTDASATGVTIRKHTYVFLSIRNVQNLSANCCHRKTAVSFARGLTAILLSSYTKISNFAQFSKSRNVPKLTGLKESGTTSENSIFHIAEERVLCVACENFGRAFRSLDGSHSSILYREERSVE